MKTLEKKSEIYYKLWDNVQNPKAVLQVFHGMVEHILRYENFAKFLNANSIIVVGMDIRGHGKTGATSNKLGYLADEDGWDLVIEDQHDLYLQLRNRYSSLPFILLGHSMGSFFARSYINTYPNDFDKAIIMGTGKVDDISYKFARLLLSFMNKSKDANMMDSMAFGSYNKSIDQPKTAYDWLSHDQNQVQKYVNDPLCGFMVKNSFYKDFMYGMNKIAKLEKDVQYKKPVLFIAGKEDPVGNYGKFVEEAFNKYKPKGNAKLTLYPKMRHEILNEIDRNKVYEDILEVILA